MKGLMAELEWLNRTAMMTAVRLDFPANRLMQPMM